MNDKVMVVIITKDKVMPACWDSILSQNYDNFDVMIHVQKPRVCLKDITDTAHVCASDFDNSFEPKNENAIFTFKFTQALRQVILKYHNCSENREISRRLALASDAQYFLFIDSDIKLPKDAIENMMDAKKDVVGGWYKIRHDDRYPSGNWIEKNLYVSRYEIEKGLSQTDQVGMGCVLFKRHVLDSIHFEHGCDKWARTFLEKGSANIILGECGALGKLMMEKNIKAYMTDKVVCEHLVEA